ncbi:MAG: iron ABC transporter permease [Loktanella sp.]|nr:iron ABC transporter permease [Loktanella sp.]
MTFITLRDSLTAHRGLTTPVVWALVALALWLLLPLGRPGRAFFPLNYDFHAFALPPGFYWLVPVAAVAIWLLQTTRLISMDRISDWQAALALSAAGGVIFFLFGTGTHFGWGALGTVLALLVSAGSALSSNSRIRGDTFVGASVFIALVFVTVFIVFPLLLVLRTAVWIDGTLTLSQFARTFASPLFLFLDNPFTEISEMGRVTTMIWIGAVTGAGLSVWRTGRIALSWRMIRPIVIWTLSGMAIGWALGIMIWGRGALPSSLLVACIAAPGGTALGFALALLGQRTRSKPLRGMLSVVSVLPFITPPFVIGFAIIFLLGRRGMVTYDLLGISPIDNPLYGIPGVALSQILGLAPVAYLILRGSLNGLNPALEEAARTLGASRWRVFCDITWPLVRPGIAASMLLATIESISDFGTPLVLGGDRNFLATEVFLALTGRYSQPEAAVYGTVLLAIVALVFVGSRVVLGAQGFTTVTGKPASGAFLPLPVWFEAILTAVALFWFVFILALYLTIFYGSFVQLWGINNTLTFQHYREFWQVGWPVLWYTIKLSAASAVPAMMLGGLIAYLVTRHRFLGRSYLELGSLLSFATPGTVMGLAYILAFNDGALLMTGTSAVIVLALVFRNMPVAIRASMAGLSQIDRSLEEASSTLKAGSGVTMVKVLAPLLLYPLLAGLIFAFVSAMTSVSQVIFLVGAGNNLATVLLLSWVEQGRLGRAAAMATVMIFGLLALILLLLVVSRRVDVRNSKKGMK